MKETKPTPVPEYDDIRKYTVRLCHKHRIEYPFDLGITQKNHLPWIKWRQPNVLTLSKGYVCDGASGPSVTSAAIDQAAFTHDPPHQLMRMGIIPFEKRKDFDLFFQSEYRRYVQESKQRRKDNNIPFSFKHDFDEIIHPLRSRYAYWILRLFGGKHAKPKNDYELVITPTDPPEQPDATTNTGVTVIEQDKTYLPETTIPGQCKRVGINEEGA